MPESTVGLIALQFTDGQEGVFARTAPGDRAVQQYIQVPLRACTRYLSYYPTPAEHPKELRLYETMRRYF